MKTYYIYNKDRRKIIKDFIMELNADYNAGKIDREIVLNYTLIELSFRGMQLSCLLKYLSDKDLDMIEFKSNKNNKATSIFVAKIHKIDYDINNKLIVFTTDDEVVEVSLD